MTSASRRRARRLGWMFALLAVVSAASAALTAQQLPGVPAGAQQAQQQSTSETESLLHAMIRLPLAAALGAVLAMRPRRASTPRRKAVVIQTQVILAVIGALVMIVVGASLARAFGVVGIAGLIRYRAKIDDPKDAGVMLAALGVGLASGVGLLWLAPFATGFLLALLWVLESREPEYAAPFTVKIKAASATNLRRAVESVLRRNKLEFELRGWEQNELSYAVQLPLGRSTEMISSALLQLGGKDEIGVEWDVRKDNA